MSPNALPQQVLDTRAAVNSHRPFQAESAADLRNYTATRKAELLALETVPIVADISRLRNLLQQQAPRRLCVAEAAELGRLVCEGSELLQVAHKRKLHDVIDLVGAIESAGFETAEDTYPRVSVDLGDAENVMWFGALLAQHAPQLAEAIISAAHFDTATNVLWWDAARLAREAA